MPTAFGGRRQHTEQTDEHREGFLESRQDLKFEDEDERLIEVANEWIIEAKPLHSAMKKKQDRNEKYYLGQQLDETKLRDYQARIILNKVFQTLETLIPRAVENLPAPMASTPPTDDRAKEVDYRKYTMQIEETMLAIAEEQNLSIKLKEFLRFHQLYYLGVLKFGYDESCGCIWIRNVRPQRLLVPPYPYEDYVVEFHEDTLRTIQKKFPKKAKEIQKQFLEHHSRKRVSENLLGSRIGYYEITTPEFKFWKVFDIVLEKERNPHYDFDNVKKNHWSKPKMDYIFSDLFTLGNSIYSETTLVDQIITLQDAINKRKRQISDNADRANGVIVAYGQGGVTKKEAAAIETARQRPDGVVFLEGGEPGSAQNFQGQQLQPYVFDDLVHTINELDNISGTHATLRGEKTPGEETFGGRQLLKESDQIRIGELVRMLERVAEKVYNAFAQLIRTHFKEDQYLVYLSSDGAQKQIKIRDKVIRDGLKIKVRQGTTLSKDKPTLSQEAIVLWQNQAIDPISLYERIGDPTPLKTAERYFLWQTQPDQLFQRVSEEYEKATKADEEQKVLNAVTQAGIENKALLEGEAVPPFPGANAQHLAVHEEIIPQVTEAAQSNPAIAQNFRNHLEAEIAQVRGDLDEKKEEENLTSKELIDKGGKIKVR